MRNEDHWVPTKFVRKGHRLRAARTTEVFVGSRLIGDLVAQFYEWALPAYATGALLDLGCGGVPFYEAYRPYAAEITCVWARGHHVDHECDLTTPLPFADSTSDTIILSDVLEHIPNPDHLWQQMARVLRPGGTVLMNVPFMYWIHAHPHDFQRYTEFALRRLVESSGLQVMGIEPIGGLAEVMADIAGKAVAKLPVAGRGMSAGIQAAGYAFSQGKTGRRVLEKSAHFPLGYSMVAVKPERANT